MTKKTYPNIGLIGEWPLGSTSWKTDNDRNMRALDALVLPLVKTVETLTAPPASPADGDCHIPGVGASGAWAGLDRKIVRYDSGNAADSRTASWEAWTPKDGWTVRCSADGLRYEYNGVNGWIEPLLNATRIQVKGLWGIDGYGDTYANDIYTGFSKRLDRFGNADLVNVTVRGAVFPYRFDPSKAMGTNLFVLSEQTAGNIIDNSYLSDSGVVTSLSTIYISSRIPVAPGQKIAAIIGGGDSLVVYGGYYNGTTWIAPITYSGQSGQYVVPANATHIRINVEKAYTGTVGIFLLPSQADAKLSKPSSMSVIGDSIVMGEGTDSDNLWWQLAGQRLGCNQFQNLGIGGSTVAYPGSVPMSRRLDAIQESDIIMLSGGANDYYYNIPLGLFSDTSDNTFYGALNVIAKYMREKFLRSRIVFVTTTHKNHANNSAGVPSDVYAQAVKNIGNENGFAVIDMYNLVPNLTIPFWRKHYTTDGVHPGIALSRIMAEHAYKALS